MNYYVRYRISKAINDHNIHIATVFNLVIGICVGKMKRMHNIEIVFIIDTNACFASKYSLISIILFS